MMCDYFSICFLSFVLDFAESIVFYGYIQFILQNVDIYKQIQSNQFLLFQK